MWKLGLIAFDPYCFEYIWTILALNPDYFLSVPQKTHVKMGTMLNLIILIFFPNSNGK